MSDQSGVQGFAGAPLGVQMKRRNPFAAWLGLPIVTLGIYHFVWYYKIHHEMAELDPRRRDQPIAGPMLVILLLGWTVIAPFVSYYRTGNRIREAQRVAGVEPTCSAVAGLLLMFVFSCGIAYYQVELNKIVDRYRPAPSGAQIVLPA